MQAVVARHVEIRRRITGRRDKTVRVSHSVQHKQAEICKSTAERKTPVNAQTHGLFAAFSGLYFLKRFTVLRVCLHCLNASVKSQIAKFQLHFM